MAKHAKYVPKHRSAKHRAEGPALLPTLPKKALIGSLAAVAVAGTGTVVASAAGGPATKPETTAKIAAAANVTPLEHAQRAAAVSRSIARPQVVGTPPAAPKVTPKPTPTPAPSQTPTPVAAPMPYVSPGSARAIAAELMAAHGWDGGQFTCLDQLWNRESHWNVYAANRSGAYGIPQALPGSKMGPGWQDNAAVQINWGLGYIGRRYGNPCGAWGHSLATGWY